MTRMPGNPERHAVGIGGKVVINVLFVEGDERYRETLASALSDREFVVQGFADATSLFQSLDATIGADVVLLDWDVPRISGIDMVAELRRHGVNSPVIFLASKPRATDETLAFDRGARDFIDKARGVEVLVRRLRRAVATANPAPASRPEKRMACGRLVLRLDIGRAYWKMSASPSANTSSFIFWCRTPVATFPIARSTITCTTMASSRAAAAMVIK